jgi:phosphatidylserine/phosphatidylglycerophosphate/cardiolipin synthase-like enzyme
MKLFEADFERQPYSSSYERFVVSPDNARERLAKFIKGARKELLIYDPKVSDDAMLRLLTDRIKNGVTVKVIGKVEAKWNVNGERYPGKRLHVRAIVRDGARLFIGSQSLRRLELEKRREIGIVVVDPAVVAQVRKTFLEDWALTPSGRKEAKKAKKEEKELAKAS